MRHDHLNFIQIRRAIVEAGQDARLSVDDVRAILDALPEPATDDWQECAWGDVLHTDERVKAEYISGTIIEGVPDGISDNGVYLVDGNLIPYSTDARWYRIPAPVQHPDPMEHHIIRCHDRENDYFWNGVTGKYMGLYDPRNLYSREDFTDWSPAKVVADDA